MTDFNRPAIERVAAKPHQCAYCGEVIAKGDTHHEATGFYEGLAFRNRFHPECFAALGEEEFSRFSEDRPPK
jgi:hypothetical protein